MIYKETQSQKSLLDFLMHIMPEMKDMKFIVFQKPTVNKQAVKKLMALWKDEESASGFRRFKRPDDMSISDIELLEKEQLVRTVGSSEIEITAKGVDIIKTTILGDERSAYEDDGKSLDYEVALANTKPKRKMVKGAKRASVEEMENGGNWYRKSVKASSDDALRNAISMLVNWGTNNVGQVTHIVEYCKAATKTAPTDQNLMTAYQMATRVVQAKSLDEIRTLAQEAKSIG